MEGWRWWSEVNWIEYNGKREDRDVNELVEMGFIMRGGRGDFFHSIVQNIYVKNIDIDISLYDFLGTLYVLVLYIFTFILLDGTGWSVGQISVTILRSIIWCSTRTIIELKKNKFKTVSYGGSFMRLVLLSL